MAQYKMLNKSAVEPFLSINIGYACAVTFGCYIAAGVSGSVDYKNNLVLGQRYIDVSKHPSE